MRQEIQFIGLSPQELSNLISQSIISQIESLNKTSVPSEAQDSNPFITRKETKELLDISYPTLNEWSKNGTLKMYKMGNRSYYKRSEVLETLTNSNQS